MMLPTGYTLFISSTIILHLQASPIPHSNLPFKLIRRMESVGLERSAQATAQFAHDSPAVDDAFKAATINSHLHSPSHDYIPDQFATRRPDDFSPRPDGSPDLQSQPSKPVPDRKASTASSRGTHGALRSLASSLAKTADALERKPLSIRLYEGTGMKALVKFLALTGRGVKYAGKRAGSLAVTGAKKTGTAVKITGEYTLGIVLGAGLLVYDGIAGLVKWTGRLAAYAAVGTYKGAKKVTQLLALGLKKTGKGAKTAAGAAAKGAKSAAVVTTKGGKTVAQATFKGGKAAAHFTVKGGKKAAQIIGDGAEKAKLGFASSIARSGDRLSKLGMGTIERAIAKSEKTGKPINLPKWIERQKRIAHLQRSHSFKLKPSPTWRKYHSGPL